MTTRKVAALFALSFSAISAAQSPWQGLIEGDINSIYQTLKDNHPGYLDEENPYFKRWLEKGYQEALRAAKNANSLKDAMTIIKAYSAGFADGHFYLTFNYQPKKVTWAGIQIERFGADYRVSNIDKTHTSLPMPEKMAKLVSCDGRSVDDIAAKDVLAYRFNAPELHFPKVWFAAEILVDDGIGQRSQFGSCQFMQNGQKQSFELDWQSVSQRYYLNKISTNSESKGFAFEALGQQQYWVSLPKFYPDKEEQQVLRQVLAEVKTVSATAKQFVIDVRGNGGGNSQWGVEIAKAIYGDDFITHQLNKTPSMSYPLWRVSKDNTAHLTAILPNILAQFGSDSSMYQAFSELTVRMETALKEGKTFIRQSPKSAAEVVVDEDPQMNVPTDSQAKVLFLTDSSCGSACLDFADLMLTLPNVTHIGQETGADTVYMDIRYVNLPSGLGQYSLAQKVYRERTRKHNQSYKPEHHYNNDISDTAKLRAWIKKLTIN